MFQLSQIKDIVRIHPSHLRKSAEIAVTDELNHKYANKVLHNVGLCIRVFDLIHVSDLVVHACQDGSYQCNVEFRLLVFRPFKGEILLGKIKDSSPTKGIRVSLGFFDDIYIPPQFLMAGSEFDPSEGVWIWKYDGNDLFMDPGEALRFRVENEDFIDIGPVKDDNASDSKSNANDANPKPSFQAPAPYTILGSISESGLGLTSWWE